jgi:hypothetical protein
MTEFVSVPASLSAASGDILDGVLRTLVEQDALPADIQFRALAIPEQQRGSVVAQDILAAMGRGEPSGHPYLNNPLPDCVFIPGVKPVANIIRELDVDYHQLGTLQYLAGRLGLHASIPRSAWLMYVTHIDAVRGQELANILEPGQEPRVFGKKNILATALGRTIIRDSALYEIYQTPSAIRGHGPERQELLRHLLVDDHLELHPDFVA